jgi:hypothetical protein
MVIDGALVMAITKSGDWRSKVDAELASGGLPSLAQVRAQFDKRIAGILKRGKVRTESEFYLLRNAVDLTFDEHERGRMNGLLDEFEFGADEPARPRRLRR